ncbi:hypothetical protein [Bathymodiolus platifrons methanotrophic gill symbiont]|uniref:hypothetical protein n=1 Tax=Bathymodiolus platifrons methanotrophic gill symbiont TaxID=113268 RepID=UPI001C8EEB88|nr:hypothetical protein [Bathymodiolus platifrons methanotrophic gill symbiont]
MFYYPSIQARHATSQHSGTPVTNIHSPTQRKGDAQVALRPSQLRTKPCSVKTYLKWLDGYSECNSCLPRALLAHFGSANCPVAYQGLKIITPLRLRFPHFKRMRFVPQHILSFYFINAVIVQQIL